MKTSDENRSRLGAASLAFLIAFLFLGFIGDFGPHLMDNATCYRYLGCNVGFFGFDGILHLFSGITEALCIVWFMSRFPSRSLFQDKVWKNIIIIVALAALIGVSWEMMEFSYDHFRMIILHQDLLHPNHLSQPSNSDTMGDLFLGLLGALGMALALYKKTPLE